MRLKLVLLASLIAALVGAGSAIAIVLVFAPSLESMTAPGLFVAATYLFPIGATFFASMFVYRHTARRRKLQAALTALISLVLTIAIFLGASMITSPGRQPPAPPRNIG